MAHRRGTIKNFAKQWSPGTPVAVETVGNWYWVVDEIEAGKGSPQLVNARLAKLMIGSVNKSDKLDAKGMNRLQRVGTLPTVWIAPSAVRDARELPRTRMVLSKQEPNSRTAFTPPWRSTGLRSKESATRLVRQGDGSSKSFPPSCRRTPSKPCA